MADILYYSNYCKHSQNIIQYFAKNNLTEKISFICIDKRIIDQKTGYTNIILENGKKVLLPPNIHHVPSLLLTKQNNKVIITLLKQNLNKALQTQQEYSRKFF